MFETIVSQLVDLNYSGRIALFSNNEPLIDSKIIERNRQLRNALPNAYIYLFSNGILCTFDKFLELIQDLDELVIDNYSNAYEMLPNVRQIYDYCRKHTQLQSKVQICLRLKDEVLTTRGGQAPNKQTTDVPKFLTCLLPFKQMIIRPDGKVSLCCNDAFGKYTMGDLATERLSDIWYGAMFTQLREQIQKSRSGLPLCEQCDNIFGYHRINSHDKLIFNGRVKFE